MTVSTAHSFTTKSIQQTKCFCSTEAHLISPVGHFEPGKSLGRRGEKASGDTDKESEDGYGKTYIQLDEGFQRRPQGGVGGQRVGGDERSSPETLCNAAVKRVESGSLSERLLPSPRFGFHFGGTTKTPKPNTSGKLHFK